MSKRVRAGGPAFWVLAAASGVAMAAYGAVVLAGMALERLRYGAAPGCLPFGEPRVYAPSDWREENRG